MAVNFEKYQAMLRAYFRVRFFKTARVDQKKLLIIQLSPLGDACTLIPFVRQAAEQGYQTDLLVGKGLAELWRHFTGVERIWEAPHRDWEKLQRDPVATKLMEQQYHTVISTSIQPLAAWWASRPSALIRLGMIENNRYYKGARSLYTAVYNAAPEEHVTRRFQQLFKMAGIKTELPGDDPAVSGKGYVLLHPGAKWKPRRWPAERFLQLAEYLETQDFEVRMLIHESEKDILDFFTRALAERKGTSILLTRSIGDLIRAMEHAAFFVGNDSGPMHLAALMRKPSIILWGPGNFERIRPMGSGMRVILHEIDCRPCRQYDNRDVCERGINECLLSISVGEVIKALNALTADR